MLTVSMPHSYEGNRIGSIDKKCSATKLLVTWIVETIRGALSQSSSFVKQLANWIAISAANLSMVVSILFG